VTVTVVRAGATRSLAVEFLDDPIYLVQHPFDGLVRPVADLPVRNVVVEEPRLFEFRAVDVDEDREEVVVAAVSP